jgi:hypothetical protein
LLESALLFAFAVVIGFVILVALFKAGILGGIAILFYRGIALIGVAAIATFTLLLFLGRGRFASVAERVRMAFAAAAVSAAFNLSFLVVLPVTVDRSITVFMLGYMASDSTRHFQPDDVRAAFSQIYLGEYRQIERRFDEQVASGNIRRAGEGYVVSDQGRRFLAASMAIAWMFDIDTRFAAPKPRVAQTRP